jgi:hypothetical protein
MSWIIDSGLGRDRSFEEHLAALLETLEANVSRIRSLPEPYEAGLQLVAKYHSANPGIHFTPEVISRIAALGLEIDVDIYCLGESSGV